MIISTFPESRTSRRASAAIAKMLLLCGLSGCSIMGASGPSARAIGNAPTESTQVADISVVDVDSRVATEIVSRSVPLPFSVVLGDGVPIGSKIGYGDVLEVSIWEAPPAVLFGSISGDSRISAATPNGIRSALPEQMVDSDGKIEVPFAGPILAAGRSPDQIASDIERKLAGLAHKPQAIVRLVRNSASNVTVVGEVANSTRMQLTSKGERLLDALASAGGVREPVSKTTIQVTRGDRVASLPLEAIIRDPAQNIRLQADDVVTAIFQPFTFVALGAVANSAEIPFEGTGLTLAQALGRAGGLRDDRADAKGVFIFRLERPERVGEAISANARLTPDGRIPVIYRINLKDPGSFFVAQSFPIRNHDVIYVSNAPIADLQKFVSLVSSMAFSIVPLQNTF